MIRVLIADDQRVNRLLLSRCLDPERYEVCEASDGYEALELFEAQRPDVVLLDVMMPRMDGFETARELKARQGSDYVPIIMVTSLSDEESLRRGMEAGADDFVPKPFNRVILESKMKASLRTREVFKTIAAKNDELRMLHERSHREQVMAEKLMASFVETTALEHPSYRFRTRPMDVFNGDLLLAARGPGGRMRLMLGDFSGHGLAAAIGGLPVVVHFEAVCARAESIWAVAWRANAELREVLPRDRFLAAVFIDYDPETRKAEVINLGMPAVLVRRRGGVCTTLDSTGVPLAILAELDAEDSVQKLTLEPGERIYLYSDGVTEAENAQGEVFGEERLVRLLTEAESPDACFDAVLEDLDGFVGDAPAGDDVTFLEMDPDRIAIDAAGPSLAAKLDLHITSEMIRCGDPLRVVEVMLESISALDGRRAEVFTAIAELVNNAVDHGVLALESEGKVDFSGFAQFYEERARRIEALEEGWVNLSLRVEREGEDYALHIVVTDSGAGFDVERCRDEATREAAYGRGLALVRALCERVSYNPRGNSVEALYRFPSTPPPPPPGEASIDPAA